MSNPYRARPGRSRVDSSVSSTNYGMHNQNSWNLMPQQRAPSVADQNTYAQNLTMSQQAKQSNDSWDWGTDTLNNGNDSWDWNLDQQTETPTPQPTAAQPPQMQPQHQASQYRAYLPPNQSVPVYSQDNYYKNVNGNNRYVPPTTPLAPNTEPYQQQQFSNYTYDQHQQQQQQQQFPPRPPSTKPQRESSTTPKPVEVMAFNQQPPNTNYNWTTTEATQNPANVQNHWPDQGKQLWVRQPQQLNENANIEYNRQWSDNQDSFVNQSRQQSFPQSTQSWHQPEKWQQQEPQWNQETAFVPASNVESSEDRNKPALLIANATTPVVEKLPKDRQDSIVSESSRASSNSKSQDNLEVDWNADIEWDTVATNDVTSNFSQMNINNEQDPRSRVIPGSKIETEDVPENVPVLQTEKNESMNYEPVKAASPANVVNSGYDKWYNHWSPQEGGEQAQWTGESNVENYENIQQQPSDFMNREVVESQNRDIYGSKESINKETLDNDPKISVTKDIPTSDFRQEQSNVEVVQSNVQVDQAPENYEFASNDRNTFLETGELTDSHQEHELTPPSQDDENDEVPNDIPFLREVPGQSSSIDRRNDPTGQEQYIQTAARIGRNDPSGQEQHLQRTITADRTERRDVPSGQERNVSVQRNEPESLDRRNIPSGRERSLLPQQSRNDPSGEERNVVQVQSILEPSETREVPGRGNETEETDQPVDSGVRQVPGSSSPNDAASVSDVSDRSKARVVTGSPEVLSSVPMNVRQDSPTDSMNKREEAVGASVRENKDLQGPSILRDSYEDGDDEGSINSRDESRERRRDPSSDRRRYEYDRKSYFDRDYDEDYYYDRRRGDYDRPFNSREDLDRRENLYRDDDRRHQSRDDLDRHSRDEDRRDRRIKDEVDDRDGRRRIDDRRRDRADDLRRDRPDDLRRRDRDPREYDMRFMRERDRERDYPDRDRRRGDDRRHRRYDDYDARDPYRRDYYDDYSRSSRPSSRSSYNDRDRDYFMRNRDPYFYNGYGYEYGSNFNNSYYAYYENLRRTNPAAYAEWYHKYYATPTAQTNARAASNYAEDRASVHSGQSSCDDRSASDKRNLTDISGLEDQTVASSRLTPTKFSTSHLKGSFSVGSMLYVYPSYPADGERARIDILRVDNVLQYDTLLRELKTYPGPLIKGVTHKKTIIEYCESKIKKAADNDDMVDRASYILLYEFMIMMIQQNGNVVGVDIATLLLKNKDAYPYNSGKDPRYLSRRESTISQRSAASGGEANISETSLITEKSDNIKPRKSIEEITDEFRRTLLYGLVQEALEYAMEEGLWGHALFLASKLDKRTHASVMTRFANSLPTQDPLQTLYQLHSGRVPASVTCIADRKWDDWRPHLAMIISNTSSNPEVNRRSITILGDTLVSRGDIHAAHFCYILAQVDFSSYDSKDAKLVLIGANHHKPYEEFASTEAIMLTEIYEYARNLSEPGFTLVDLQSFKFTMATKMVDHGLLEKALLYIEQVAINIVKEPSKYNKSFINDVYTLGDRIKYHDPICKDSLEDAANLTWLNNLAEVVNKCQSGEIIQENSTYAPIISDTKSYSNVEAEQQNQQPMWVQPEYQEGSNSMMEVTSATDSQNNWQPRSLPGTIPEQYDQTNQYTQNVVEQNQYQQQDYWQNQQSYISQDYSGQDYSQSDWQQQTQSNQQYGTGQPENDANQQQQNWDYEPRPTISLAPSSGNKYDLLEELDALDSPKQKSQQQPAQETKKSTEKQAEKKSSSSGGSWFGGFLSKLAPKPKNQMILPDDSNPSIVWDPVQKKWMNKEEDGENGSAPLAPPPKVSDMSFGGGSSAALPPLPTKPNSAMSDDTKSINQSKVISGNNMFKMQKNRSMRSNYIDVMNPNSTKSSSRPAPIASPSLMPMAASSPQLFTPAPVNDSNAPMDYLTPAPTVLSATTDTTSQGLSRWSSTSSLSREVQSYTMRDPRQFHRDKVPMMQKSVPQNQYPPR